jgi:hypothetical protein
MSIPEPDSLLRRKRYGREEYVQDLLAALIVGGDPPRWNTPAHPTQRGTQLLATIARESPTGDPLAFFNEFELVRRRESEVSGWPDFATVSADKLVMIELKTEPASHRPGQLAHYADLAAHHHPALERRLIYVTPPLSTSAVVDAIEFQHVYWTDVSRAISEIWSTAPDDERDLAEYLVDFLGALATPWKHPYPNDRAPKPRTPAPSSIVSLDETVSPSTDLHDVAAAVANDGKQRAVDISWEDPDDMERFRLDLRNQLIAAGSSVRPRTWRAATSGGTALTPMGAELGYELRLSRYKALPSDGA